MERVTIDLDESLREFVDRKVEAGRYALASVVVIEALREAQTRESKAKLDVMLADGVNSDAPIEAGEEYWAKKRTRIGMPSAK